MEPPEAEESASGAAAGAESPGPAPAGTGGALPEAGDGGAAEAPGGGGADGGVEEGATGAGMEEGATGAGMEEGATGAGIPFHCSGEEFTEPHGLALRLNRDRRGWEVGASMLANGLGRVLEWLRESGRPGDADRAERALTGTPHEKLFTFIRMFAPESPPSFLGMPLTYDNLAGILTAYDDPPDEGRRILDAIMEGELRGLPGIAGAYGTPLEEEVGVILAKGRGKTAVTLACAVAAREAPDLFIWGPPGQRNGAKAIAYVLKQGCPLLTRAWWEGVTRRDCPFPQERFNEFISSGRYCWGRDTSNYSQTSQRLSENIWETFELNDLLDPIAVGEGILFSELSDIWGLTDNSGRSLAHAAARSGALPPFSNSWELWERLDSQGESVAHVAAENGYLPERFDRWEILNREGKSVAHAAADRGGLPRFFGRWDTVDGNGESLAHMLLREDKLPAGFGMWEIKDDSGEPLAHEAARLGKLPENFYNWELMNDDGDSVAHVAARCGNLPKDFKKWGLVNSRGITVARTAGFHTWLKFKLGILPTSFLDRYQ
jgi:hypothetical protein